MNPAYIGFAINGPWTLLYLRAEGSFRGLPVCFQLCVCSGIIAPWALTVQWGDLVALLQT